MSRDSMEPKPSKNRRWIVPPPYLTSERGLPGGQIVSELSDNLGVLLWQAWRDIELWATAEPEERDKLFRETAYPRRLERLSALHAPEPLRAPLRGLAEVLRSADVKAATVTADCLRISAWASDERHPGTAVAFAQAGALASPENASAAVEVGIVVRNAADYPRAESWFRRAVAIGRRTENWEAYSRAYCGIANIFIQRGAVPLGEKALLRALRTTRRHGVWSVRGSVFHHLSVLAANAGRFEDADRLALRALKAYGKLHVRLPVLAHDVAWSWMLRGYFTRAIPIFQALVPRLPNKSERLMALANLARAAGAARMPGEYAQAWDAIWKIVGNGESTERVSEALIGLARGAASLRDLERAHVAAQYALGVALLRKESHARLEAESVLDSLSRAECAIVASMPVPEDPGGEPPTQLSRRLLRVLATSTA